MPLTFMEPGQSLMASLDHFPISHLKESRHQKLFYGTYAPPVALSPPSHVVIDSCRLLSASLWLALQGFDAMRSVSSTKE